MIDAVVTHHTDGFRSGVARFNELLADRLAVPLLTLAAAPDETTCPLLSFKVSELGAASGYVERLVAELPAWELFLHEYGGVRLERLLVERAQRVHCGNAEIHERVRRLNRSAQSLWTPGLITDVRPLPDAELTVFTFGMAHKIRTDVFRRLRNLLDATTRRYAVLVSAANHETVSLHDSEAVFAEMHRIFPDELFFLGNLSDVAVSACIGRTTFFAAFFDPAVRANNTSVASAMEHGAAVITNLDTFSPQEYRHAETVFDIESVDALPLDPETLEQLGGRAAAAMRRRGWDALVARLASSG